MIQIEFAQRAKEILETDQHTIGLAVGGSWIANQIDEFSDLDLIIVTDEKISDNKDKMVDYAKRLGSFLSAFTGEHVGEPRLLICLYDNPLLHVDIKFVTLEEFHHRVETPTILFDKDNRLQKAINDSTSNFPYPDYQWIEDRFWIWIHYALLKIGRGEYFEAFDFLGFLRMVVFGPLLHIKNNNLPRGVRKVEMELNKGDLEDLKLTLPHYDRKSLLECLHHSVLLYRQLRKVLFDTSIILQNETERKVMLYFQDLEKK
ncbi:hypothetical protein [Chryseobacterium paridis]|uniref:Nucleotidyltransferase domain-containing protein n=1 Tax=Chryseobacterium paridis TaxID=2800328 RepID=A0ABS1FTN2_9FLAO|nr:hypothetical protein [Chryseobacterium paridis]MBK1895623.1 hypothetical protein [Chryseobacterium paridis]